MTECPFTVGDHYTRQKIYELLAVPEDRRRGNWETGYTKWENAFFLFPTVGKEATGGFDYDNRWDGDDFLWQAKSGTKLKHPQIRELLESGRIVYLFTRPQVRQPFKFEGTITPVSYEDTTPVSVRWKIDELKSDQIVPEPYELVETEALLEGAISKVSVNSYERRPKARKACIEA